MWKRRAEIGILALLVVIAGANRPHAHIATPSVELVGLMPERIDSVRDVGLVALTIAVHLLD